MLLLRPFLNPKNISRSFLCCLFFSDITENPRGACDPMRSLASHFVFREDNTWMDRILLACSSLWRKQRARARRAAPPGSQVGLETSRIYWFSPWKVSTPSYRSRWTLLLHSWETWYRADEPHGSTWYLEQTNILHAPVIRVEENKRGEELSGGGWSVCKRDSTYDPRSAMVWRPGIYLTQRVSVCIL